MNLLPVWFPMCAEADSVACHDDVSVKVPQCRPIANHCQQHESLSSGGRVRQLTVFCCGVLKKRIVFCVDNSPCHFVIPTHDSISISLYNSSNVGFIWQDLQQFGDHARTFSRCAHNVDFVGVACADCAEQWHQCCEASCESGP